MNKFLIRTISFGCALGFSSPAWSRPPHPAPHHAGYGQVGPRADRNRDGHVGPVEHREAINKRNDVNTRKEEHWDTNNNGQVDKHEAKARVNTPGEKRIDTNKDGIVEGVEKKQAVDKRNDVNTRKEEHWDTNNDGQVDKHEANARVDTRWENKADKNNDGLVDTTEKTMFDTAHPKDQAQVDTKWEHHVDKNKDGIVEPVELPANQ